MPPHSSLTDTNASAAGLQDSLGNCSASSHRDQLPDRTQKYLQTTNVCWEDRQQQGEQKAGLLLLVNVGFEELQWYRVTCQKPRFVVIPLKLKALPLDSRAGPPLYHNAHQQLPSHRVLATEEIIIFPVVRPQALQEEQPCNNVQYFHSIQFPWLLTCHFRCVKEEVVKKRKQNISHFRKSNSIFHLAQHWGIATTVPLCTHVCTERKTAICIRQMKPQKIQANKPIKSNYRDFFFKVQTQKQVKDRFRIGFS